MFRNLSIYRPGPAGVPPLAALQAGLEKAVFAPCAPTQPTSVGWVPPRGEQHAPLVEVVGGQWLLELRIETRLLPGSVVRERIAERARRIEQETGRKPGRRVQRELKDEAVLELLPRAFTKRASVPVWIDPKARLVMLDAGSRARTDAAITALVAAAGTLAPMPIATASSPAAAMAGWLAEGDAPAGFTVDRDAELKSPDEAKATVRYARHPLDIDEVREHVRAGKRPTRLALTWRGRISFVLTETLELRRLAFVDGVLDGGDDEAGFDAEAALATGELRQLIPDLVEALGGEPGDAQPAGGL